MTLRIRLIFLAAALAAIVLHPSAAVAANCFCRLQCYTNILQQFTDPAGAYTQIGNTEVKACNRYCAGWFDGTAQSGGFTGYTQNWQQHMQCVGLNMAAHTCTMSLLIRDAVGTAPYYQARLKGFTASLSTNCPAGQQLSFDGEKCGTATNIVLPGAQNGYIQPNWFTNNGTIYLIAGNAAKVCSGWH